MLAHSKIKSTSLIHYYQSTILKIVFVRQCPDFLDRIIRRRSCIQQNINIFVFSFQSQIYFIPIQIGISVLGIHNIVSLMDKKLFCPFEQMRIRSIEENIHFSITTIVLDIGKKIGTKISSVEIWQPLFLRQKIKNLEGNPVHQYQIGVENCILIQPIYSININGLVVCQQRFT